ncbi:MAG: hypothetical protein AB3N33_00270 [Puniceicoccaceae bacterium]
MKTCPKCGKTVLWGGVRKNDQTYCCANCYRQDNPDAEDAETVKDSLGYRIITGFGMVYAACMLVAMIGAILYDVFFGPGPWYTSPGLVSLFEIIFGFVIFILVIVAALFLFKGSWRFLMGTRSFEFDETAIEHLREFDFAQPVERIGFRTGFRATGYRYKGRKIAYFDPGPGNLSIPDIKDYHYSCWAVDDVDNRVLKPGSAELAIIYDDHKTIVETEEEADSAFYGFDGTTVFYKSGEIEEMAHSETPYNTPAERVIVIGKRIIRARYFKLGKIELTDYYSSRPFGYIRDLLFWGHTRFMQPLPLIDGIFITNLARSGGAETNPYDGV